MFYGIGSSPFQQSFPALSGSDSDYFPGAGPICGFYSGFSVLKDDAFFNIGLYEACRSQVKIRFRFSTDGAVIECDSINRKPSVQVKVPEEKFDVIETGSCGNRKWNLSFCQRIQKCGKPGGQMKVFPVSCSRN